MATTHESTRAAGPATLGRVSRERFDATWPLTLLPLGGDEVYSLGLPWEPWLSYDTCLATEGDAAIVLPLAAALRVKWVRAWRLARGLLARLAGKGGGGD